MPVEFLTDEQAESYGTFTQEPTRPELERFFFLDDEDRRLIGKRRGDHSRLGFALQVCTVRHVGSLQQDPLAVPWPVALFNRAVAWLRRHRVLLPAVSVLARQVSAARTAAEDRLHSSVARAAHRVDRALPPALVALLPVPVGDCGSVSQRTRQGGLSQYLHHQGLPDVQDACQPV